MKITCEREKMLHAFQTAAMVAPTRSPKPILNHVRMDVAESGVILMATDMEIGIRVEVPGIQVEGAGKAVLPNVRFGSILRESSDEKLYIEADSQGALIKGDRSEFKLPGENPDEFPAVVMFEEQSYHEIPARLFRELIRRTIFATDTESSRYALGGVLIELSDDQITAVATDGRRLAKMQGPAQSIKGHKTGESMTIIPTRAMQMMERALTDADAEIQIAARQNDVLVRAPRLNIYSRLVEGRFPPWREAFPKREDSIKIDMTVGPMHSALRQAAIVASDDSRGIDFTFGEGSLVLSGSTADVGQSRVELPISYDGPPVTVSLDHRYVSDFLRALDADKTFTIDIEGPESAALFSTDDGYGYVVMPLARDR